MSRTAKISPSFDQRLRNARAEFAEPADLAKFLPAGPAAKLVALRALADLKLTWVTAPYERLKQNGSDRKPLKVVDSNWMPGNVGIGAMSFSGEVVKVEFDWVETSEP